MLQPNILIQLLILSSLCLGITTSCVQYQAIPAGFYWVKELDPADASFCCNELYEHRSPTTKYSARSGFRVGAAAGSLVGLPFALMALPLTTSDNADSGMIAVVPYVIAECAVGSVTGAMIGWPAWAVSGWWWPKTDKDHPPVPPSSN